MLRGFITTVVLSSVDITRMFNGKISGAQLFKNVTTTASGVAGGTAGWLGGASAGAAIGSAVPIIGTAAGGIIGGVIGSVAGGAGANKLAQAAVDSFIKDDAEEMLEILQDVFSDLAVTYLLTETEGTDVLELFKSDRDMGDYLRDMFASKDAYNFAKSDLEPAVRKVIRSRRLIKMPSSREIARETEVLLEEAA